MSNIFLQSAIFKLYFTPKSIFCLSLPHVVNISDSIKTVADHPFDLTICFLNYRNVSLKKPSLDELIELVMFKVQAQTKSQCYFKVL